MYLQRIGILAQTQASVWDGLQSYWRIDETSGTAIADAINYANGTLASGTINNTGKNNKCWNSTSNSGQAITLGNKFNFEYNNAFTINAWVNPTAGYSYYSIFSKENGASPYEGYQFRIYNTVLHLLLINRLAAPLAWIYVSTVDTISNAQWTMVTATYTGSGVASGIQFYKNGGICTKNAPIADNLSSGSIVTASGINCCVAGQHGSTQTFVGSVDEVGVWNKALSQADITELYNSGTGKFY